MFEKTMRSLLYEKLGVRRSPNCLLSYSESYFCVDFVDLVLLGQPRL